MTMSAPSMRPHGEFLQVRALNLLKRGLGDRLGLYALAQKARPDAETGRGQAYGSGIVYLHSKVVIADDRAALVSSANLNGRSFRWDTEAGLLWTEEASIRELRERLWHSHLDGGDTADGRPPEACRARIRAVEAARRPRISRARPRRGAGFAIPYQIGRARRFARAAASSCPTT